MTKARILSLLLAASLLLTAAAPAVPALQGELTVVPLTDLGVEPFAALSGPYDQLTLPFELSPDRRIEDGSSLLLDLQTFFSSFVPAQDGVAQEDLVAGNLAVSIDGQLVERLVLSQNGQQQLVVPLPAALFAGDSPQHELALVWDATASCDLNLSSTVIIDPTSALQLAQAFTPFNADLGQLPYPFFTRNGLSPAGTLLILPNGASADQLSAGLSLVAGLGRASADPVSLLTESQLSSNDRASHHLIFVGPLAAFASLNGVSLPHAGRSLPAGAGFVELASSPWNPGLALLVISGDSDAAILSAARQTASGDLVLDAQANLAVLQGEFLAAAPADTLSATFAQLGQGDLTFEHYGRSQASLSFYVQPGRPVSSLATLDLRFAHSKLVDYLRSGLSLDLNGQPLTSVRLSDQTSPRHSEMVLIAPSALRPGWNTLDITADVLPLDLCAREQDGQHWLTLYGDSTFSLPTEQNAAEPTAPGGLGDLSAFFAGQMEATSLLLPEGNAPAWSAAAQLLRGLAAQSWPLLPQVGFLGSAPDGNVVVVSDFAGYAESPLPGLSLLQPSNAASGLITLTDGRQLPYQAGAGLSLLAAAERPEGGRALVILGDDASLPQAVDRLLQPAFAAQNLETRLLVLQGGTAIRDQGAPAAEAPAPQPTEAPLLPAQVSRNFYLLPLLLLLLVALGLLLGQQGYAWVKKRLGR